MLSSTNGTIKMMMMMMIGVVISVLAVSSASAYEHDRLAGYQPLTSIHEMAVIDIDMSVMEELADLGMIDPARAIYEDGANSRPVSKLTLVNATPPLATIPAGTKVVGRSMGGSVIQGTLIKSIVWQEPTEIVSLHIEYDARPNQTTFCRLGGLAQAGRAEVSGCFEYAGWVQILDFSPGAPVYHYKYGYEPYLDTYNIASFQRLSTNLELLAGEVGYPTSQTDGSSLTEGHHKIDTHTSANSGINSTDNDTTKSNTNSDEKLIFGRHHAKYASYYDALDYADQFIQAALDGRSTSFLHGNANFASYRSRSRVEVVRIATKTLTVWMSVIHQLESALESCQVPCGDQYGTRCDDIPVRAWDQAYALYAGSLQGNDGQGDGYLLFDLANNMCHKTNTCSESGTANVNVELVQLFTDGQLAVLRRECHDGNDIKEEIVKLMTVPLIQAIFHEAYYDHAVISETEDITKLQRVSYVAAILPLIHECNSSDAERIYFSMGLDIGEMLNYTSDIDFVSIKRTLEQNYQCLGVSCASVGGVWDGSEYVSNGSPCTFDEPSTTTSHQKSNTALIATLSVISVVIVVAIVAILIAKRRLQGIDHSYKDSEEPPERDFDDDHELSFGSHRWQIPEGQLTTVPLD